MIYAEILSRIRQGFPIWIPAGISSRLLPRILSWSPSGILSGIPFGISSGNPAWISLGILPEILKVIPNVIPSIIPPRNLLETPKFFQKLLKGIVPGIPARILPSALQNYFRGCSLDSLV